MGLSKLGSEMAWMTAQVPAMDRWAANATTVSKRALTVARVLERDGAAARFHGRSLGGS